jgi:hypothetical protein
MFINVWGRDRIRGSWGRKGRKSAEFLEQHQHHRPYAVEVFGEAKPPQGLSFLAHCGGFAAAVSQNQ